MLLDQSSIKESILRSMAGLMLHLPSSISPSSHTMTVSPVQPTSIDLYPTCDQTLISTLSTSSYTFLQPPPSLHAAALVLAKRYLDPLATSVSETQQERLQETRRKRKRGVDDDRGANKILRLNQVHLEGFGVDQIWEQARRVLDASVLEIEGCLPNLLQDTGETEPAEEDGVTRDTSRNGRAVRFDLEGVEARKYDQDESEQGSPSIKNISVGSQISQPESDDDARESDLLDGQEDGDFLEDEDEDEIGIDDTNLRLDDRETGYQAETFVSDRHGLNDGFFSIDDFNRTSEFLEQQDVRGDPNDGAANDEEEIDWDADPMSHPVSSASILNPPKSDEEQDYNESESDGPTFGNADLNAPDTGSESDDSSSLKDTNVASNTNDIKYADFFAPPPRALTKSSRRRALPKTQPPTTNSQPISPDDVQRTISLVRRDLFEDELSPNASDSDPSPNGANSLSTHQKRQAALSAQIRQLEAANVAKRDWTLSGEARAAERPLNSLLEEDLEFERIGKPVVVVTKEVSEDIEALIKRRILAREFDEVVRRRPGSEPVVARRGRIELEDTQDKRGLAEIYEEEHLKRVDPTGHGDKRDEKVRRQHEEIERLWRDVSGKLDALSSWHYKPKPPEVNVHVVSDVPAVRMEDARPNGVGGVGELGSGSMLAPQEVYRAGEERVGGEIVAGGLPIRKEEMNREEKLRRRRREKERIKKGGGLGEKKTEGRGGFTNDGKKAKEKKGVTADLKNGGVRVIGKKGEVRDVEGKLVKGATSVKGGGGFKL